MGKLGEILSHPEEFLPLVRMYRAASRVTKLPKDPDLAFCYDILNNVSRSFAIVIQQLPNPLRDAICVFYLILRGLDTIEDDMALENSFKIPQLKDFHKRIYDRGFNMVCGAKHYKRLMENFGTVVNVFLGLEVPHQNVIADITKRMGYGMAEFVEKDEVQTVQDYDKYCHYVAGLVGIGLSNLFAASGFESPSLAKDIDLANDMGLFLQKTNIIRDYLEDIMEEPAPRMFWPREIWGRYAARLADFKEAHNRHQAIKCLNHMVTDALRHVPFCLQYLERLHHGLVFRFCAIPQLMAIGTLALCYNNGHVFEGVVKMRRGQTASLFESCNNMGDVYQGFMKFLQIMETKLSTQVAADDPSLPVTQQLVASNLQLCRQGWMEWRRVHRPPPDSALAVTRDFLALALSGTYFYYVWGLGGSGPNALPEPLQQYGWVLQQHRCVQQVMSALLLILVFVVFASSRRST